MSTTPIVTFRPYGGPPLIQRDLPPHVGQSPGSYVQPPPVYPRGGVIAPAETPVTHKGTAIPAALLLGLAGYGLYSLTGSVLIPVLVAGGLVWYFSDKVPMSTPAKP